MENVHYCSDGTRPILSDGCDLIGLRLPSVDVLLTCVGLSTHRELPSFGQDVDGVLLLTNVVQAGSVATSGCSFTSSCLLSSCLLCLSISTPVLQGDAQSEVFGQMVHCGVGGRLHVPAQEEHLDVRGPPQRISSWFQTLPSSCWKAAVCERLTAGRSDLTWSGCSPDHGPAVGAV